MHMWSRICILICDHPEVYSCLFVWQLVFLFFQLWRCQFFFFSRLISLNIPLVSLDSLWIKALKHITSIYVASKTSVWTLKWVHILYYIYWTNVENYLSAYLRVNLLQIQDLFWNSSYHVSLEYKLLQAIFFKWLYQFPVSFESYYNSLLIIKKEGEIYLTNVISVSKMIADMFLTSISSPFPKVAYGIRRIHVSVTTWATWPLPHAKPDLLTLQEELRSSKVCNRDLLSVY